MAKSVRRGTLNTEPNDVVVAVVDRALGDNASRLRGIEHAVAPEVDADMRSAIHHDDVTRQGGGARDRRANATLRGGRVRQSNTELRIDVGDEARTVEPGRALATKLVGHAEVLLGNADNRTQVEIRIRRIREQSLQR